MSEKNELRKELKAFRKAVHNKNDDADIVNHLIQSELFKTSEAVLLYAALDDEINIDSVICASLDMGKKTALPVCADNKGTMSFYYISSPDDLKTGFFSVREPDIKKCRICDDFKNSICVVPGIAFDRRGYRLGYGKGYYDRFLENFSSLSVGLCYNELLKSFLPCDKFDRSVDYIITQKGIIMSHSEEDYNG